MIAREGDLLQLPTAGSTFQDQSSNPFINRLKEYMSMSIYAEKHLTGAAPAPGKPPDPGAQERPPCPFHLILGVLVGVSCGGAPGISCVASRSHISSL